MDDLCEISLKSVCCTCLSTERNLSQLCRIEDGVNNLFFLLSCKSEAYEAMFVKDVTQLFICWECTAIIQRLVRFRDQVCIAQTKLTDIADGKLHYSKVKCLSKLAYSHQNGYNQEFDIKVEMPENFVDCGPDILNTKVETPDTDEVPLAELRYLKKEVEINNDEINDNYDDYIMTDDDINDSFPLKKLNNGKRKVKNRDTPIIVYRNNKITSSINMLENVKKSKNIKRRETSSLADEETDHDQNIIIKSETKNKITSSINMLENFKKSKNIKRRQKSSLAEDSDDEETDHDQNIIINSEIETSKRKRSKNMEAHIVNIPISNSDKTDKFNEIQKLNDGKVSLINKSQSEKNLDRNRDLEPVEKHRVVNRDFEPVVSHIKTTNKITSSINMLENVKMSKNIKRRQKSSLAEDSDDEETDHDQNIIIKSETETSKRKRSKNMEAHIVNIPISNSDKADKFNEIQKLNDGKVSLITKSQSEKNLDRNRDLEPVEKHKVINTDLEPVKKRKVINRDLEPVKKRKVTNRDLVVSHIKATKNRINDCFDIIQMTENEMVKSIEMRKLEDDYANALNKCEACVQIFEDCDSLEKHISVFHAQKPNHVLCNICKVYVLDEHINTHKKVHYTKYVCRICKESLQCRVDCKRNVKDHLKIKHLMQESYIDEQMKMLKEREDILLLYKNPLPEAKYGAKLKFLLDDPKGRGFACVKCNKYFKNKILRHQHTQKFHSEGYQCPTCGKKFPLSAALRRHEIIHCNPLPPVQCSVCGKMVRADLVKAHARVHAATTRYACAACDKSFMTRDIYERHLKYARGHADRPEFQHKCAACGKDYRLPEELRDHYNYAHLGKTHHKCPICDKALATARCVTKHIKRAHRDKKEKVRDQICQTCGKGFTCQKSLKEHELIHTGERPLSCDICARTFRQKASLYTHKRRVHKVALKKKPTHTDEIIVPNSKINKNID